MTGTESIARAIIRREWPSVAGDLADGIDTDTVRDRAAETFDGEEYGRLCALLEVHEAEIDRKCTGFRLEIVTGNAAMGSGGDVAAALADVAESIRDGGGWLEGTIRDGNGNTVGSYGLGAV